MSPHRASPRHLLLVEDNPGDAKLIEALLYGRDWDDQTTRVADTLGMALTTLADSQVDAVLLDLRLPDGDGVECVHAVRRVVPDVPVVVLTGIDDENLALSCIEAGAQDYVCKAEMNTQGLHRALAYAVARVRERAAAARAETFRARLATIVESSHDAILSATIDGVVTSWNVGAESLFGFPRHQAIGHSVRDLLNVTASSETERTARLDELLKLPDKEQTRHLLEVTVGDRDMVLWVTTCLLRDAAGEATEFAAICRDITELQQLNNELRQKNVELTERDKQMRALTGRLHALREDERSRISREVHDELGQVLTALQLDIGWVVRRLRNGPPQLNAELGPRLAEAASLVDSTVKTVQRIAVELRPSVLDTLGLPEALQDEARRFSKRTGTHVDMDIDESARPTGDVATALFRICQELLTNVARHAHASKVTVQLVDGDGYLKLRVSDNGVGMRPSAPGLDSSLGLLGVRERADSLGGSVNFEGSPDVGTTATVNVPFTSTMEA